MEALNCKFFKGLLQSLTNSMAVINICMYVHTSIQLTKSAVNRTNVTVLKLKLDVLCKHLQWTGKVPSILVT